MPSSYPYYPGGNFSDTIFQCRFGAFDSRIGAFNIAFFFVSSTIFLLCHQKTTWSLHKKRTFFSSRNGKLERSTKVETKPTYAG